MGFCQATYFPVLEMKVKHLWNNLEHFWDVQGKEAELEKVESVAELTAVPANLNGDKACVLFNLPDVFLRNKIWVM